MADTTESTPTVYPPPTLHHLTSSQSLRVLWALEELYLKGQTYQLVVHDRIAARAPPEMKEIFPLGKAPILVIEPIAGSEVTEKIVIAESRLVLQYISDHYSDGIWDPATDDKMRNEYWQEFANNTLYSTLMLAMAFDSVATASPFLMRPLMSMISRAAVGMIKKELVNPYALMEAALSDGKEWFAGQKMGLADFNMSWPMDLAIQRGYFDKATYPKVTAWYEKVQQLPAYKSALAKGGLYNLATFGR